MLVNCRQSDSGESPLQSPKDRPLPQDGSRDSEAGIQSRDSSPSSRCSLDSLEGPGHGRGSGGVGQDDAWEIVQDGSQLSDFRGSQLQSAELQSGSGPSTLRHSELFMFHVHRCKPHFFSFCNVCGLHHFRNTSSIVKEVEAESRQKAGSCKVFSKC